MPLINRTLFILRHLWTTSDESHPITLEKLKDYLETCGLSRPDSRTLKNDIAQLIEFGVDIVVDRRVQNQYFIASRHFDTAEIKLLIDAVQSSRFITPKKSKALIAKLAIFVDPGQKQLLKRQLYIDQRAKASNEAVLRIVDHLHTAITEKKKVTFRYFDYTPEKKKVHRHNGQSYIVSPYAMLWNNDLYYMVGYSDAKDLVATYRVDRIDKLEVMDVPARKRPPDFSVAGYCTQAFSMYSGKECQVELLCENELMGSIIDRFGPDVRTEVVDGEHFKVTASVALSGNFYGWIFASQGRMKILSPEKAASDFSGILSRFTN